MKFQTYRQFVQEESHFEWLVEDLIPEKSWTLLVGPPGSGKSLMALQLTQCIQEGQDFLNMKVKKGNCLYIQADASEGEWQEQIKNIAPDGSSWTGYEVPKNALDIDKNIEDFKSIVWGIHPAKAFENIQFDFVVFDCLRSLTEKDINSPAIMNVIRRMEYICSMEQGEIKLKKTFMLIHHPTVTRGARGVSAGSGYQGLASDCGSMLTLAGTMLAREKGRISKNKHIDLVRLDNGAWAVAESHSRSSKAPVTYGPQGITQAERELLDKYPELMGRN